MALYGKNSRTWAEDGRHYSLEEDERGLPGYVKNTYDQALADTGKWLGGSMLAAMGSGFMKGVLVAAAAVIVTAVIFSGFQAIGASPEVSWNTGIDRGFSEAFGFLGSNWGLASLGIAGAVGAAADVTRLQQEKIREIEEAKALMQQLSRTRALEPQKQKEAPCLQQEKESSTPQFVAAEMARRQQAELDAAKGTGIC